MNVVTTRECQMRLPALIFGTFFLFNFLDQTASATIFSSSVQSCQEQCVDRNIIVPLPKANTSWEGLTFNDCDFTCRVEACRTGCQDLDSLTESVCDTRCASTESIESCQQGCRAVAEIFVHQIQYLLLNKLSAEVSLDLTQGIRLNWSFDAADSSTVQEISSANLRWVAQSRESSSVGWRWIDLDTKAFKDGSMDSTVFIPFQESTDIQVRLAVIWRDSTVIVSRIFSQVVPLPPADSLAHSTHHAKIRELPGAKLQVSSNSYAICWHSDHFSDTLHAPVKYRLRVFTTEPNSEMDGHVMPISTYYASSTCYLLRSLPLENCCRVGIAAETETESATSSSETSHNIDESTTANIDNSDAGDMLSRNFGEEYLMNVSLKQIQDINTNDEEMSLLFTNGTAILQLNNVNDFVVLMEPTVIPFISLSDGQSITALASVSHRTLLVGLSDGSIYSWDISTFMEKKDDATITVQPEKIRDADAVAITQLVVDHMQSKIYAVRDKSGLIRCPSLHSCQNTTMLMTNSLSYIQTIAVDSINGFLYYGTNTGDTFSTPLFPLDAPPVFALSITRRLAEIQAVASLQVDSHEHRLICVLRNGSFFSRDLVDESVRDERAGFNLSDSYKAVSRAQFHQDRLFWISRSCGDSHPWPTCLFSEEKQPENQYIHLNKYLYGGPVQDFVLMKDFRYPAFIPSPLKTGLTVDETEARLNWKPPVSLPFQASGSSWRALTYEYTLNFNPTEEFSLLATATNESLNDVSTSATGLATTTVTTVSVGAGNLTSNVTDVFLSLLSGATGTYTANVRACTQGICSLPVKASNKAFREGVRKTITFYTSKPLETEEQKAVESSTTNVRYGILDALGRNVPPDKWQDFPTVPSETDAIVAFDNTTGALYATSKREMSVFRLLENGLRYRFLDYLTINHIAVMPSRSLLWMASSYTIVAYRLTSSFEKMIYNCANEECGEVVGLAADDSGLGRVFYFIQLKNGTVQMYSFNDVQTTPQLISVTSHFHTVRQMIVVDDRFIFLTPDGQVGSFDLKFTTFNFNLALRDIAFLLIGDWFQPEENHRIHFKGPIEFEQKGELVWNVEPMPPGSAQILYKIQLYRDSFGGERTVDLAQTNCYAIPKQVLDKWDSRQKFDVQIDVITPWTVISANKTSVNAPTKPPSPPTNLKIYATQQKTVDGTRAIIDLFWDEPREWNGDMVGYVVNCSIDENSGAFVGGNISVKHSRSFSFSVKSGKVVCAVAATNEQNMIGSFSEQIPIDGSEFRPLIRLFAIDSTDSLVAIQNWTVPVQDPSKLAKHRAKKQTNSAHYQALSFIGTEWKESGSIASGLYAIRKEGDSQLFLVLLDPNDISNVIYKGSLSGEFNNGIEAMTSDWVANRLLLIANHDILQISLDSLQQISLITPKKLFSLSAGAQDAKQLTLDPFANSAYLLTKNGSLFKLDLNKGSEENLALSMDCLKSQTVTSVVAEFTWNRASSPLIYALTWNGMVAFNPMSDSTKCSDINVNIDALSSEKGLKGVSNFATVTDKFFIFFTSNELLIYDRNSALVSPISVSNPPLRQILAASQSSQPYPDRSCFVLPPPSNINFTVKNDGRTGAIVEVQEPQIQSSSCVNISFPQTQYEMQFKKKGTDKVKIVLSSARLVRVENGILDKDAEYDVSVSWYNRYNPSQGMSEGKPFKTGYGFPSPPVEPAAWSLSPDTALLNWKMPTNLNAPIGEIRYKVSQLSSSVSAPTAIGVKQYDNGEFSPLISDIVSCNKNPCQAKVTNLRASTTYQFWITALHINRLNSQLSDDTEATSTEAKVQTKDVPGILRLDNVTSSSLMLRWNWLNPSNTPADIFVQYKQSGVDASWIELPQPINTTFDLELNYPVNFAIEDLHSATTYDYRYKAVYTGELTYDTLQQQFFESYFLQTQQARTKAGTPSAPLDVKVIEDKDGSVLKWSPPKSDGGEPITSYAVEFRPDSQSEWEIAERGLPAERFSWRIGRPWVSNGDSSSDSTKAPLDATTDSEFRVRAANVEGFGAYGSSVPDGQQEMDEDHSNHNLWMYILLSILFSILLVCTILFVTDRHRKLKRMRKKQKIHKVISLEDIARQIQFPTSQNFPPEVENEIRNLPHVHRSCIHPLRNKILGKGSFGEVVEGIFRETDPHLGPQNDKGVRVAVKYLKDDTEENRLKFLKEAVLMNNFDHPNIIKLLGVYRESQPNFLVFELMEGGDLHTFLNNSRPPRAQSPQLSIRELVNMMVDIGRGATYLETFKHVHRDLAARNCLITSKKSPQRATKIGDFGLARDMFSSDYYKVHGADFLPLRWLSPESAIQGIFTSKSDVWAFGIVLWEIMTFGSQPYTGITNLDVLIRLKEGKPPERPHNCPDEIYEIMALAWTFGPEKRPKFVDLLPKLEILRSKQYLQTTEPFPWTAVNVNNANSFTNNAFDNSHDSISSFANPSNASGSIKTIDGLESQGEIHARFDKSENRSTRRHGRLPKLLKPDTKNDRPGSSISAETEVTTLDYDYEIPRNRTVNRHSPYISSKAGPSVMGEFSNEAFVGDASLDSSDNLQAVSSQLTNYSAFSNSSATVPSTPECSKPARTLPLSLNRNFAGESNSIKSENGGSSSPRRFATSASSAPLPDSPSHRVTRVSRV